MQNDFKAFISRKTHCELEVITPGAEAKICLKCTLKKCKGDCDRFRQEKQKLKDKNQNGK